MRKFIVRVAVCVLRLINLLFLPFHQKERVVMISRQSDTPTLDICLLSEELEKHNIKFVILAKTLKKSLTGMISYGFHLLCQMYYLATSKVVIVDGYCILVSILPKRNGQCVIQMWHALGAIKKFGWQNTENPDGHGRQFSEIMQMHRNYDYVLAPGRITGHIFSEAFRIPEQKIVYYGLPRIDFIRKNDVENQKKLESTYPKIEKKANVLYVPTFRKNAELTLEPFIAGFDFERYNLIIKKHFLDKGDYSWAEEAGAIVDSRFSSLEWLRICNKVITDYSAMAFEAAIAEKELYIFQPDEKKYMHNVGLNVDLRQEDIGDYVCDSEETLFTKMKEPYKMNKLNAFCEKYIEVDLEHCTASLCGFVKTLF